MDIVLLFKMIMIHLIPVAAIAYAFVGFIFLKRKCHKYFVLLMFSSAIYSFGFFLEKIMIDPQIALNIRYFQYFGAILLPAAGILFVFEITKFVKITNKLKALLFSISAVLFVIYLTNDYHGQFYKTIDFEVQSGIGIIVTQRNVLYFLLLAYYAAFLLISNITFYKTYKKTKGNVKKRSYLFLFLTFLTGWVAFPLVAFDLGQLDPVPFFIMFICYLIAYNAIKNDLFDTKVQEWQRTSFIGNDPTILLDGEGNVVGKNQRFNNLEEKMRAKITQNVKKLLDAELLKSVVSVEINGFTHWLELTKNPYDAKKELTAVVIFDITEITQKQEELNYLSFFDPLTDINNRRYYDQQIKLYDNEDNYPLCLVMFDVNGLKLINDAFGHNVGDKVLYQFARILKNKARVDDVVARIGGDEFILLMPGTNETMASEIIDKIKEQVSNEKIDNINLSVSAGFAIKQSDNQDMNEIFIRAEDMMYRLKLYESLSMRSKTIDLIKNTLYEKSPREMLHSQRVAELSSKIAKEMKLPDLQINQVMITGLMHDIGKIGIDDNILNDPNLWLDEDGHEMKRHTDIGYRILSSVNEFSQIADYVLEHHEKFDGSGYPKGLKGDEISLAAKIVAVADAYDAMTFDRPYRKTLTPKMANNEIKKYRGKQFDPKVVDIFLKKVNPL